MTVHAAETKAKLPSFNVLIYILISRLSLLDWMNIKNVKSHSLTLLTLRLSQICVKSSGQMPPCLPLDAHD